MITDKQLKSIANDEHQSDEINLWNLMIEMAKEILELRKELENSKTLTV
jgi:hypothetical protein